MSYSRKLELVLFSSSSQHRENIFAVPKMKGWAPTLQKGYKGQKGGANQTAHSSGEHSYFFHCFQGHQKCKASRGCCSGMPLLLPLQQWLLSHIQSFLQAAGTIFQGFGWSNSAVPILLSLAIYRPRSCACNENQAWIHQCLFAQNQKSTVQFSWL